MAAPDSNMKAIMEKLQEGVKDVFTSGRYQQYLNTMARFHRYSFRNSMLIFLQNPDATRVAGFGAWKSLGRSVNKGEKGIQILAPSPYKHRVTVTHESNGAPLAEPREQEITVMAFRPVCVFDVSQTQGKELPSLVNRLSGDVEEYRCMMDALQKISPCPVGFEKMEGNKNGYFLPGEGRIAIREGLSQEQTVKTLIHEIAHARFGHGSKDDNTNRQTGEVQAESVAYIVCQHLGIDSSNYSFGYVANWSRSQELEALQQSLAAIQTTAQEIVASLEEHLTPARQVETTIVPPKSVNDRLAAAKQTSSRKTEQKLDEPQKERRIER